MTYNKIPERIFSLVFSTYPVQNVTTKRYSNVVLTLCRHRIVERKLIKQTLEKCNPSTKSFIIILHENEAVVCAKKLIRN